MINKIHRAACRDRGRVHCFPVPLLLRRVFLARSLLVAPCSPYFALVVPGYLQSLYQRVSRSSVLQPNFVNVFREYSKSEKITVYITGGWFFSVFLLFSSAIFSTTYRFVTRICINFIFFFFDSLFI